MSKPAPVCAQNPFLSLPIAVLHFVRQSRIYTFAVVAIAATLIGAAFVQRQVEVATATLSISQSAVPLVGHELSPDAAIPTHDPAVVAAEIVSHDNVSLALAALSTAADDLVTEDIATRIEVSDVAQQAGHTRQITIRYHGPAPDGLDTSSFATAVVESLAQRYVDKHHGRGDRRPLARWEVAREAKRAAQDTLKAARLKLHLANIKHETEVAAKSDTAQRRNPRWLKVHQQLLDATRKRDDLAEHVTAEHPELKEFEKLITELSRSLTATPQWVAVEQSPEFRSRRSTAKELSAALAKHQHTDSRRRAAEAELKTAQSQLDAAVATERETYAAAAKACQLEVRWSADPETLSEMQKRVPQQSTSLALMLALASGSLAAVCVGRPNAKFVNAHQVRKLLATPVLAVLPVDGESTKHATPIGLWLAGSARIASEATILAFMAAIVVCLVSDGTFAADLTNQPLTTLSSSIERSWSLVTR